MRVKFCLGSKRDTAVRARDYFLFGMASHVISEFVQAGIFAVASGPFAFDSVLDFVTAWAVCHVYGNVIQIHLIIREQFQALFPPAQMWGWTIYDVSPFWISVAFL